MEAYRLKLEQEDKRKATELNAAEEKKRDAGARPKTANYTKAASSTNIAPTSLAPALVTSALIGPAHVSPV